MTVPGAHNARQRARRSAERNGRWAEALAMLWLRCKLYRIVGRRIRTAAGEIDLIVRSPDGMMCFVEVKARARYDRAAEAISAYQRARIVRAAMLYLGTHPGLRHKGVRFDAILIAPNRPPRHHRDAWRPDGP